VSTAAINNAGADNGVGPGRSQQRVPDGVGEISVAVVNIGRQHVFVCCLAGM
jgi:hypothetical protein